MGISSAAENFQYIIGEVIKGVRGAANVYDDIIIFGANRKEHDKHMHELLQCLESAGLTLDTDKCKFYKNSIEFFGVIFSKHGIAPSPKRVEAFALAASPTTVSEVRSVLATAN